MNEIRNPPSGWQNVAQPPSLFRRFEFSGYAETRAFLDRLAGLSETAGYYPDLGFGRTHVNVTIRLAKDEAVRNAAFDFAVQAGALMQAELV